MAPTKRRRPTRRPQRRARSSASSGALPGATHHTQTARFFPPLERPDPTPPPPPPPPPPPQHLPLLKRNPCPPSRAGKITTLGEVSGVVPPTAASGGRAARHRPGPGDEDTLFVYCTTGSDNRVARVSLAGGRVGRPKAVLDRHPDQHPPPRRPAAVRRRRHAAGLHRRRRAVRRWPRTGTPWPARSCGSGPTAAPPRATRSTTGPGRTVTATSRDSPSTPTVGCGRRSSATRRPTSST